MEQTTSQKRLMERIAENSKQLAKVIKENPTLLQKVKAMDKGFMLEAFLLNIAKKNGLRGKHFSYKIVLENLNP